MLVMQHAAHWDFRENRIKFRFSAATRVVIFPDVISPCQCRDFKQQLCYKNIPAGEQVYNHCYCKQNKIDDEWKAADHCDKIYRSLKLHNVVQLLYVDFFRKKMFRKK
jgi:hypothetical protein